MWPCKWLFLAVIQLIASPVWAQAAQSDDARRSRIIYAATGGVTVRVGEVEDAIHRLSPSERPSASELRAFSQRMLDDKLMAKHAEARGLENHPLVQRRVKELLVQTLLERAIDRELTPASISDADVRRAYELAPQEYRRPEMRRACHIVLPERAKAQALLAEARKVDMHGFQELAKKHSADQRTNLRGGDLGYFSQDAEPDDVSIDRSLRQAAFDLNPVGAVHNRPIKVAAGWAILKLTGLRPAQAQTLVEAAPLIRRRLWQERRAAAVQALFTRLEDKYDPKVEARF